MNRQCILIGFIYGLIAAGFIDALLNLSNSFGIGNYRKYLLHVILFVLTAFGIVWIVVRG